MFMKFVTVMISAMFFGLTYQNIVNPTQPIDQTELSMWWVIGIIGGLFFVTMFLLVWIISRHENNRLGGSL